MTRLGELLVEAGVITREQLSKALSFQTQTGARLGTNLVELGFIDEPTLARVLARQLNLPSATAAQLDNIPVAVLRLVPAAIAEKWRAVPVRIDGNRLWMAMAEPTDKVGLYELEQASKMTVRPMIAPELLIQYALEKHYLVVRRRIGVAISGAPSQVIAGTPAHERRAQPRPAELTSPGTRAASLSPPRPPAPPAVGSANPFLPAANPEEMLSYISDEGFAGNATTETVSLADVAQQMAIADSDEAVLRAALQFLARIAPDRVVLVLKKGTLVGYIGDGPLVQVAQLPTLSIKLEENPVLRRIVAEKELFVGAIGTVMLGRVAGVLGLTRDVPGFVLPISMKGAPLGCIIGVRGTSNLAAHKALLTRLTEKIDYGMQRSYLLRQLLAP